MVAGVDNQPACASQVPDNVVPVGIGADVSHSQTDYRIPRQPSDWEPVPGFDFSFLQFEAATGLATVETDIVVVGSGCGGSVCAKVLAEAGHRVLVVDKGYPFPPSQLLLPQEQGIRLLFEGSGVVNSTDGSINCLAGLCWGGGGTVNWSVSLQTQDFVHREWARECGLPFFETHEFQDCLDRVCDFMGVSENNVTHNRGNQVLLEGCEKLGCQAAVAPQNYSGETHPCGHCHYGCGRAKKRGPVVSWLPAATKAGATFVEGLQADHFPQSLGPASIIVDQRHLEDAIKDPCRRRSAQPVLQSIVVFCVSSVACRFFSRWIFFEPFFFWSTFSSVKVLLVLEGEVQFHPVSRVPYKS